MKRPLIIALKLAVSLALISYLVIDAQRSDPHTFTRFRAEPLQWSLFAAAVACAWTGLTIGVVRWHLLLRTLDLPYRLAATFRVAVLAYLFDFVAVGAAGGDLVRAVLLARDQPGRGARSVASVVVDRAVGFSATLLTTSIVTLCIPVHDLAPPVRAIVGTTRLLTVLGAIGMILLLVPRTPYAPLVRLLGRVPRLGGMLLQLIEAIRMYRTRLTVLAVAVSMAVVTLGLNVTAVYLIVQSLPGGGPTWGEHLLIVPLVLLSGIIPLPAQGLGMADYTISYLYSHVPSTTVAAGQGLLVTMGYRMISTLVVIVGAGFYVTSPRKVTDVLHDTGAATGSLHLEK